jgi:hypothetical protein
MPDGVAEYDDVIAAGLVFTGKKRAAKSRRDAGDSEIIRRDARGRKLFGVYVAAHGDRVEVRGGHAGERTALCAPIEIIRRGDAALVRVEIERRIDGADHHEAIGILHGRLAEQHRIHDAKDRGVDADSERERENRDRGKAGIFKQHADRVTNVLPKSFERGEGPKLAANFLQKRNIAEAAAGSGASFFGPGALGAIFLGTHGEMELQLFFQIAIEPSADDQGLDAKPKFRQRLT